MEKGSWLAACIQCCLLPGVDAMWPAALSFCLETFSWTHPEVCIANLLGALPCDEVRQINHHKEKEMGLMTALMFCVMSNEWSCLVMSPIYPPREMALQNNIGKGQASLLEKLWCARLSGHTFRTTLIENLKLSYIFPFIFLSRSWSQSWKEVRRSRESSKAYGGAQQRDLTVENTAHNKVTIF